MQRAGTITPVNSRLVTGGVVGVTASVAVAGSGVELGEAVGVLGIRAVGEAACRRVGEADGSSGVRALVTEGGVAGGTALWQPLASTVKASKLVASLLVRLKNRLGGFLDRLETWGMDW